MTVSVNKAVPTAQPSVARPAVNAEAARLTDALMNAEGDKQQMSTATDAMAFLMSADAKSLSAKDARLLHRALGAVVGGLGKGWGPKTQTNGKVTALVKHMESNFPKQVRSGVAKTVAFLQSPEAKTLDHESRNMLFTKLGFAQDALERHEAGGGTLARP